MNGGYLNAGDFLRFVHNAENGVKERGMFEGRGPLMILLLVLVMAFAVAILGIGLNWLYDPARVI